MRLTASTSSSAYNCFREPTFPVYGADPCERIDGVPRTHWWETLLYKLLKCINNSSPKSTNHRMHLISRGWVFIPNEKKEMRIFGSKRYRNLLRDTIDGHSFEKLYQKLVLCVSSRGSKHLETIKAPGLRCCAFILFYSLLQYFNWRYVDDTFALVPDLDKPWY